MNVEETALAKRLQSFHSKLDGDVWKYSEVRTAREWDHPPAHREWRQWNLREHAAHRLQRNGVGGEARHPVVPIGDGKNAGVVLEPQLTKDVDGPERIAYDREVRGAKAGYAIAGNILES